MKSSTSFSISEFNFEGILLHKEIKNKYDKNSEVENETKWCNEFVCYGAKQSEKRKEEY